MFYILYGFIEQTWLHMDRTIHLRINNPHRNQAVYHTDTLVHCQG